MMTREILDELDKEEPTEFHKALLSHCKVRVKRSRTKMSASYPDWDYHDSVYRGEVLVDPEQRDLARRGKPTKMIVPNTFAQCMTFTSFLFLMFNQNRTFFELNPTGDEDAGTKRKDCELVLERDLRHNAWNTLLFQHLLDTSRFGLGILECSWTRETTRAFVAPPPMPTGIVGLDGQPVNIQGESAWQEFLKFEGNQVKAVSPYRWFPDTSYPLTDFRRGEFCATEEEYSMGQLRTLQAAGEVEGIDFIQPLPGNGNLTAFNETRGGVTRSALADSATSFMKNSEFSPTKSHANVLVTKCQVKIVPAQFKFGPEQKPLDASQDFEVLYHVWYANDNRIIRAEPAMWWHGEFGWTLSQFTPDMHRIVNAGLADLVAHLQDVISWFVNSHISSVRRVIGNRLVVNPAVIDPASLDGEKDVYLRKGVNVPLDRAVSQLKVQDVTGQHMTDVESLGKIMELVTGVNGNAMGQYNSGRRSAQEARVVTAGAAGRMKLHGHLIWESSLGRLGRLMLSNSRQGLSAEAFRWVIGKAALADPNRYALFKGTPEEVICGDDFMVFDSTLASEKGFMAQSVQELIGVILSANPMAAMQLTQTMDLRKMVDEMFYLRGSGNVSRFAYDAGQQPPPMMPQVVPGGAPQPAAGGAVA